MNKKYLYGLSALMLVSGMATMTSCQSEEDLIGGGQKVMLTISADKQDEATRTQFTPSGKDLNSVWTAGDQLLITTHSGIAGVVTLSSGAGTASGVFKGEVTLSDNGEDEIALFYLGKGVDPANVKDKKYIIDLSSQTDNLEGLAEKDFLATTTLVKNMNGTATASVAMNRLVDEAYFTLALPDGLTLGEGDVVTISGDNMTVGRAITLSNTSGDVWGWDNTAANQVTGSITVTKTSEMGNALYFTMHGNQTVAPTFTVTKDGYRYTATMSTAHTWNGSQFVNNNGEPIAVTDWTKEKEPTDPGDFDNWPSNSEDGDMTYTVIGPYFDSEDGGWTNNIRNIYNMGGWVRTVEYTNGLFHGLLTSNSSSCFYFQWGRYLGFPSNVAGSSKEAPGASYLPLLIGYLGKSGTPVKYTAEYMGNSSSDNLKRSLDWAIVFGQTNNKQLDYLYGNGSHSSWEERCGNPCPDGYRVPTKNELLVLRPSTGQVKGSYAEIKNINGKKYAMKWVVGSSNNISYVDVYSVETTLNSVTTSSSVFNGLTPKRVWAYGYLMDNGEQSNWGSVACYWASDANLNNALDGVSGYGGYILYIEFEGTTANFGDDGMTMPFGFGAPVMPIKDESAKAIKITPLFPYSSDYTSLPKWIGN